MNPLLGREEGTVVMAGDCREQLSIIEQNNNGKFVKQNNSKAS